MPRSRRNFVDGGVYHIIQRGNNGNKLFFSDNDYSMFLKLLRKYKTKFAFDLYNYCLMPNHIHLLLRIIEKENMSQLLQGLLQSFQYHHRREYDYRGFLYQNRYKSLFVNNDSYLMECARYIERNPLRAKLVDSLEHYNWSSYNFYAKGDPDPLITPNPLYMELAKTTCKRKRSYIEYVSKNRPCEYEELLEQNMEKLR